MNSRRDFIKNTVMAGIGVSVLGNDSTMDEPGECTTENALGSPGVTKKVIVGVAVLACVVCAYELMKKSHEVVVLEASGRHGGHVLTVHDGLSDGLYGDFGQEHITKPGYDRYWSYTREFNLEVLPYPRRQSILRRIDGKYYTEQMLADPAV